MQTGSQTGLGFLAGVDERVCGGREGQRVVLDRGRLRRVRGFRVCSYAAACVTGHHGREEAGGGLRVGFARGIGVDGGHDCVGDGPRVGFSPFAGRGGWRDYVHIRR